MHVSRPPRHANAGHASLGLAAQSCGEAGYNVAEKGGERVACDCSDMCFMPWEAFVHLRDLQSHGVHAQGAVALGS